MLLVLVQRVRSVEWSFHPAIYPKEAYKEAHINYKLFSFLAQAYY